MVKFIMPDNLSEETNTFMTDVIKELNKRRVIQNIDLGALRMLATSYETYKRATDAVLKDGAVIEINRTPTLNPAQNAATKSYSQVMKIMTEYGLTILPACTAFTFARTAAGSFSTFTLKMHARTGSPHWLPHSVFTT
ncbi:Phage terminase, small subunit [Bacteroidales bacterium Barb6]|nr:Phage terminase, small subunit [Bacteroidales bacterium Barb6]OAV72582.1 Phage terminase, small subunit [Bacteroidales bacterium Barb6]